MNELLSRPTFRKEALSCCSSLLAIVPACLLCTEGEWSPPGVLVKHLTNQVLTSDTVPARVPTFSYFSSLDSRNEAGSVSITK